MLVAGFPAGAWGTNCWVLATAPGEECVVVDPGHEAVAPLDDLLREHRLRPVAVVLTHGHLDHTFSVAPVCGARDVPAWIHPEDRHLLADPGAGLDRALSGALGALQFTEPDDVRTLDDHAVLSLAGLDLEVRHTPGHTRGSVVFRLADELLLSGDLLFAGSIGRTDLPGGDGAAMLRSLAEVVLPLPDELLVLPGHGATTTVGRERASNPWLAEVREQRAAVEGAAQVDGATRRGW